MLQSPTLSSLSWGRVSPLEILITRACEPSLPEPNYATHLEVAEYINTKKANNPREAAMTLARLANNRNPHISMLALSLLSTLTQSCGYPFHLQISTKEFLNELVRRFPERPPPYPNAVMSKILELIHGWKEGICQESRWKEDLGNIRDMHRLLTFKGYRFRDFPTSTHAVADTATVTANLKTASELESEDREAQSAKLQELIRRGTPRDLAAAQELMKALAGAIPDEQKPDYRSLAMKEINKLEAKVVLMNEMLDNVHLDEQGNIKERFVSGDAYDQVAAILKAARPKLQKWVSEAEEGTRDSEELDTFLQMNDQINSVLNRYESFMKGDYVAAANPIPAELSTNAAGPSLINFDVESGSDANSGPSQPDDLMGLFGASANAPLPAIESRIGLGLPGMTPPIQSYTPPPQQRPPISVGTPPVYSSSPSMMGMGMGVQQQRTASPNYFGNMGVGTSVGTDIGTGIGAGIGAGLGTGIGTGTGMRSGMSPFASQSHTTSMPTQAAASPQTQVKDPFADLAGLF